MTDTTNAIMENPAFVAKRIVRISEYADAESRPNHQRHTESHVSACAQCEGRQAEQAVWRL